MRSGDKQDTELITLKDTNQVSEIQNLSLSRIQTRFTGEIQNLSSLRIQGW